MNEYIFVEGGMIGTDRHVIGRGLRQMLPIICLLLAVPGLAQPDRQWVLEKSTLTYHVSHPLHDTDGISHAARPVSSRQRAHPIARSGLWIIHDLMRSRDRVRRADRPVQAGALPTGDRGNLHPRSEERRV